MTAEQFGMFKAYMNVFQVFEEAGLEPEVKIKRYSNNG
jgi:hypothetical protein